MPTCGLCINYNSCIIKGKNRSVGLKPFLLDALLCNNIIKQILRSTSDRRVFGLEYSEARACAALVYTIPN